MPLQSYQAWNMVLQSPLFPTISSDKVCDIKDFSPEIDNLGRVTPFNPDTFFYKTARVVALFAIGFFIAPISLCYHGLYNNGNLNPNLEIVEVEIKLVLLTYLTAITALSYLRTKPRIIKTLIPDLILIPEKFSLYKVILTLLALQSFKIIVKCAQDPYFSRFLFYPYCLGDEYVASDFIRTLQAKEILGIRKADVKEIHNRVETKMVSHLEKICALLQPIDLKEVVADNMPSCRQKDVAENMLSCEQIKQKKLTFISEILKIVEQQADKLTKAQKNKLKNNGKRN